MSLRTFVQALWWRILILTPAALAIWYLDRAGNYRALIFDGGWTTRFYVVAWIVLTPYLGWFITATGRLTFSLIKYEASQSVDEFFVGAATLILIGFGLGALSVLFPQLVLGLAIAVLLRDMRSLKMPPAFRADYSILVKSPLLLLLLCSAILLLGTVFLDRAVMPDVASSDVQQLYVPYLAEVARNHSIWLAADNPIFSDFETGHGNGLHLLMATFLPPQVAQIISFLYYGAICAVIFQLARLVLPFRAFSPRWEHAVIPTALGIAVLGLSAPIIVAPASAASSLYLIEFGKYHLQTAAFFLYLLLISIRAIGNGDLLAAGICGFAIAVSYPVYAAYAFLISGLAAFVKLVQRDTFGLAVSATVGAAAAAGCILSFTINYFYLGIPATNPYSVFRHFVSIDRFSRFGSLDILDFFVLAQSLQVSDFFSSHGLVMFFGQAAAILGIVAIVAITVFIVAFADSKLFLDRPSGSDIRPPGATGLAILVAYFASVRFLDLALNIPSLTRLSVHATALFPLIIVAIAFWGLAIFRRFEPAWFTGRMTPTILVLTLLVVCTGTVYSYPLHNLRDSSALQFAKGRALTKLPHITWNWERCDELQQATGADRVLPLNGYRTMVPCYFSLLLTRGKIVHTYESDVARDFRKIALGNADSAETDLRSLGVNLFYIEKRNCDFWLNGFAELFEKDQLNRRFSVYRETPDYWILTWKNANQPLSAADETGISNLITRSKEIYREAYGITPFEAVKRHLPSYGSSGDINALEELFTCGKPN